MPQPIGWPTVVTAIVALYGAALSPQSNLRLDKQTQAGKSQGYARLCSSERQHVAGGHFDRSGESEL
jgi:type II secretory pathway pseudopilin PulG